MNWKRKLLVFCGLAACVSLSAQYQVLDPDEGRPIPGASVQVNRPNGGAIFMATDAEGRFALDDGPVRTVRVSFIGYEDLEFMVDTLPGGCVTMRKATFSIGQAVVTGQYGLRNDANAVQSVHVISREDIDRIAAVSLRDVLLTQSTLNITHDAQLGTNVQMLGLSGQHVQIMIDGVPIIGRVNGQIDFDQLPLDEVLRIEIIEGPMSVEYGSEAIAGAINLITRNPSDTRNSARVRATAESIGRYQAGVNFRQKVAPKLSVQGNASRLFFEGRLPMGDGRSLQWKPKEQYMASLGLQGGGDQLKWGVSADYLHERLWNDGEVNYSSQTEMLNDSTLGVFQMPFARDSEFRTQRMLYRADLNGRLAALDVEGFISFNHYSRERVSFLNDLVAQEQRPLLGEGMNDTALFYTWHSRASLAHQGSGTLAWSLGYDARLERGSGDRIAGQMQEMTHLALFGSAEWRPHPNWVLRPGARWVYNSRFGTPFVPSFHLKWSSGSHALRASFARGFRAPELKELFFLFVDVNHNIQGSDALEAEVSNSTQVKYEFSKARDRFFYQWSVTAFMNDVSNLIDLSLVDSETQLYQYVNLGRVISQGVTAAGRWEGGRIGLKAQATYVYREARFGASMEEQMANTSLQFAFSTDYKFHESAGLSLQANHQHREAITLSDPNGELQISELSPFTNLGLFLHKEFGKSGVRGTIGVDNVLDLQNRTLSGEEVNTGAHSSASGGRSVSPGRNLRFSLQWNIRT